MALQASASPPQTSQVPPRLSVDDAVRIGLKNNPQVAGGLAGIAASLATYRSLGVPAPITLGASQVQGTSTAPTLTGDSVDTIVDVAGTVDTSGQRRYQAAGANATFKATKYQFLETIVGLEQQIRDAYWSLAAAQAQAKIAAISLDEAQRVYELTVTQEKAGASPRGDVIRSTIDVANAKQALLTAQSADQTALIVFNNLLARAPGDQADLANDLGDDSTPIPHFDLPAIQELNALAASQRPTLKASDEQVHAATYSVRQAESSRLPDLNLQYQRSAHTQVDALTVSLSFPFFDFGGIGQTIKAAKESRKQAVAQKAQTEQQVAQQVAQARNDLESALKAADSYRSEILTPSKTLLTIAKLGYQQGATGILPVIDAETTIRNARVGYIATLLAIYKAQDELLAATGKTSMVVPSKSR